MTTYQDFLERRRQLGGDHGFDPIVMPDWLFPFQRQLVEWAVRKGRAAIFADCGMGKAPMGLTWAENVVQHTWRPVLVVAPLAVTHQLAAEATKFGYSAAVSRDGSTPAGITITNYDRLHYFRPDDFAGLVCDESSAIKSLEGQRRRDITEFARKLPYRLLCTATAAPNDYIELGTSSEALGELGAVDLLNRFFVNKQNNIATRRSHGQASEWRFKGHAEEPFWRYVASWARAIRRPSDYGYPDDGFALPPLVERQHVVGESVAAEGKFGYGMKEEREEARRSIEIRCQKAAELVADVDRAIVWCQLNDEGDRLVDLIDGAVQVKGSDSAETKEERLAAFTRGEIRVLVSKASIAGFGLNWQHCSRVVYFPNHSYEQYYQAVRRCWRFGQTRPVEVDLITTPGAARALDSLQRKGAQADRMFDALVAHMNNAIRVDRDERFPLPLTLPDWAAA